MEKDAFTGFKTDFTYYKQAKRFIAHGALTNSKRAESYVYGVYPTHLSGGFGSRVWTPKGEVFVDFVCGLGTNILGYGNRHLTKKLSGALENAWCPSLPTTIEISAAKKLIEWLGWPEQVRFLKTGSEACMAAVRIARAYNGRALLLSEGYHGHSDEFVSLTPPAFGVLAHRDIKKLEMDYDLQDIKRAAAVIVEPVDLDASPLRKAWLQRLRTHCKENDTVLIFDEIITGFRWPQGSVSKNWGIEPDLICVGKAMANGLPVAAVAGKQKIMECNEYFVSSTFAGETFSLTAMVETINLLQTKFDLRELWSAGEQFAKKFNETFEGIVELRGYPTRGRFFGDAVKKTLFFQEACKAGMLFGPSFFLNFAHIDFLPSYHGTLADIAQKIKTGQATLEGRVPESPFSQKQREQTT